MLNLLFPQGLIPRVLLACLALAGLLLWMATSKIHELHDERAVLKRDLGLAVGKLEELATSRSELEFKLREANKRARKIRTQTDSEVQYLLIQPAPATCEGAIDLLKEAARATQ